MGRDNDDDSFRRRLRREKSNEDEKLRLLWPNLLGRCVAFGTKRWKREIANDDRNGYLDVGPRRSWRATKCVATDDKLLTE